MFFLNELFFSESFSQLPVVVPVAERGRYGVLLSRYLCLCEKHSMVAGSVWYTVVTLAELWRQMPTERDGHGEQD